MYSDLSGQKSSLHFLLFFLRSPSEPGHLNILLKTNASCAVQKDEEVSCFMPFILTIALVTLHKMIFKRPS